MQHINTNIRAKFKQIMVNQCLEIGLQPFLLLWVSLIMGDYHFVNDILHLKFYINAYFHCIFYKNI